METNLPRVLVTVSESCNSTKQTRMHAHTVYGPVYNDRRRRREQNDTLHSTHTNPIQNNSSPVRVAHREDTSPPYNTSQASKHRDNSSASFARFVARVIERTRKSQQLGLQRAFWSHLKSTEEKHLCSSKV